LGGVGGKGATVLRPYKRTFLSEEIG